MFRRLILSFIFVSLASVSLAANWVQVLRVRQVQCATDRWAPWSIHDLQVGVLKQNNSNEIEPEVYSFREKHNFAVKWEHSKTQRFCRTLQDAMDSGRTVQLRVDDAGQLLDLRL